jgi:electron transfer flavoprotein beta subunit
MHIAVVLRLVPDITEELEIAESGTDIDREWIGIKLNEFDDHALEEAVLLKEASGATVTAIALDGEGTDRMLQTAVARGADGAIKVTHELERMGDARAVAAVLAPVLTDLGAELVLTGVQTPEDLLGQLAPYLGVRLGWPHVSAVSGVKRNGSGVTVQQEYSGGVAATLELALPAVIGVQTATHPPRYVSGSKLRQVMGSDLIKTAASDAATAPGPAAEVLSFAPPEEGQGAQMLDGDPEEIADKIVAALTDRGLLKG